MTPLTSAARWAASAVATAVAPFPAATATVSAAACTAQPILLPRGCVDAARWLRVGGWARSMATNATAAASARAAIPLPSPASLLSTSRAVCRTRAPAVSRRFFASSSTPTRPNATSASSKAMPNTTPTPGGRGGGERGRSAATTSASASNLATPAARSTAGSSSSASAGGAGSATTNAPLSPAQQRAAERTARELAVRARRAEESSKAEQAALEAEPFASGWRKKGWWTPRRRYYLKIMCATWPALFAGLLMLYEQHLGSDADRARYELARSERLKAVGKDPQAAGLPRRDKEGRRIVDRDAVVYFADTPAQENAPNGAKNGVGRKPIRFKKEEVPLPLVAEDQGVLAVPRRGAAPGSLIDVLPPKTH